jgi:hypothetical protein
MVSEPTAPDTIQTPDDDLTSQELASRFQDVLAYFVSLPPGDAAVAHFTKTYTPQLSLLRGRLDDLHLNRCEMRPSTIEAAGNGLFATRDILKGEMITLFPGDAILFRDGERMEASGVLFGNAGTNHPKSGATSLTGDAARAYEIRTSATHSIVGDKTMIHDSAYLGHMANDAVSLTKGDDTSRTIYSKASAEAANAAFQDVHDGCHFGLFSSRLIQKGEEIFVSYGEGYWLSRSTNEVFRESQSGDAERRATTTKRKKVKSKKNKGSKTGTSPGNGF